ncbi:Rha family transcriptional regulator [Pseudomonas syringae]|uniref:Rha family transcriptional regulator n=1 Tax=Pseudomonas syringae TaxID=317 RepID=UPI003F74EE54
MSSLEIAELTGKQPSNVGRDIRKMLADLGDDSKLSHVHEEKDARGYTKAYHLDRELTQTLITGYSAPLRLKVIRRLNELEGLQICRSPEQVSNGAIIESLSGLQTEVKILKEMIRSIIAGPGVVREVTELSFESSYKDSTGRSYVGSTSLAGM